MKKRILAVLLTAVFASTACYAGTPAVEKGRQIFVKYCVKCHGEDGSGSEYGRYLKTNPVRDLRTNRLFLSDTELFIVINHGASWREMPNWEYVLNEEETQDVAWYLRTLKFTPDPKEGERIFKDKCALCHATDGAAKKLWKAPDLDLSALGPFEMARLIRYGSHGTLMYPREVLHTNAEIADVVDYIQNIKK
jgi:mono/diheme cytochrome c family protein